MTLVQLLSNWQNERTIAENIVEWHTIDNIPPQYVPFPSELDPRLASALRDKGIDNLYTHQLQAWEALKQDENVIITTGTASGKTLCYNLPIIHTLLEKPSSRALYLFPTKALAQDQVSALTSLIVSIEQNRHGRKPISPLTPAVYDGDTPPHHRVGIRQKVNLLITNPDMLHIAILPHHTLWCEFLKQLRFVVIDEIHSYRGVFGSHIANVIRRLRRVAHFYGADPRFILTSATIANSVQLAEKLIEAPVRLIDQDGSPHNRRHYILYNPPIVQPQTGIRRSAYAETLRLAGDLLNYHVQSLIFTRSRRTVEIALKTLQHQQGEHSRSIHGYRSGYLPGERRTIESDLRSGQARMVVATNALELGIDIGQMSAVILVGYPGSIAAFRQQTGRAGRRQEDSLAVMVASANPLDQYLIKNSAYLFDRSPEQVLINPDNLLILLQHLRCAAFELPFHSGEGFGSVPQELLEELLNVLVLNGILHITPKGSYHWIADQYPASQVSLRTSSDQPVILQLDNEMKPETIGEVDQSSAYWMVHPQAIYLHQGQSYLVEALDLKQGSARLTPAMTDYFTEPHREVNIERLNTRFEKVIKGGQISFGDIQVTIQVTGYRKIRWFSQDILGDYPLEMPSTILRTTALWLSLDEAAVDQLRQAGYWSSDPNNYGSNWNVQRLRARQRDKFICQSCGAPERGQAHHVHHIEPFRSFTSPGIANQLDNLITLCPSCHQRAEQHVRMRTGLAGLSYAFQHLAPITVMCDINDIGVHSDPQSPVTLGRPTVIVYDQVPDGIGLSENLYCNHSELLQRTAEVITSCECQDGCPACVGPAGEKGSGGKKETLALLSILGYAEIPS